VATSSLEGQGPADRVGCIRILALQDGARIGERLLSLDDAARSYVYAILEGPFPVTGYVSTLRVTPVTDGGRSFVEWFSVFECEPEAAGELVSLFEGAVYKGGLDALKSRFGG
jgi:Polyketide cyclase / dehydrase and lipid transport